MCSEPYFSALSGHLHMLLITSQDLVGYVRVWCPFLASSAVALSCAEVIPLNGAQRTSGAFFFLFLFHFISTWGIEKVAVIQCETICFWFAENTFLFRCCSVKCCQTAHGLQ